MKREISKVPRNAVVLVVANQKGGCGKTTTAINLSHGLARRGMHVLVIDTDPQGNTTKVLCDPELISQYRTLADFFSAPEVTLNSCIHKTKYDQVDAVYSHVDLFTVKLRMMSEPINYMKLKTHMPQPVRDQYDYIIIDTPPDLGGVLITNAMSVADAIIVPVGTEDAFALQGVKQLGDFITSVKGGLNPLIKILGILITMRDDRSKITKAMLKAIPNAFGPDSIFNTYIKRNVAVSSASAKRMSAFDFDPKQQGAKDYADFVQEIIQLNKEGKIKAG